MTESCWSLLGKSPSSLMCASSRMVVKRNGANAPMIVACTLIPYAEEFELGATLADALEPVQLNHSHCSRFCVLGGASCSISIKFPTATSSCCLADASFAPCTNASAG